MTPRPGSGAIAQWDLVIQGPGLNAAAVEAFAREVPHAAAERHPQSARLRDVQPGAAGPALDALSARWRCDAAVVPANLQWSAFRVLALDMDSTLIRHECIDELALRAGVGPEVAAITEAAMRGEIADYAESLKRRVALMAGADAALLQWVAAHRLELTPGAEALARTARSQGLATLLVSGGAGFFARRLRDMLQLDFVAANEIETQDGRLTGRVTGPVPSPDILLDAEGKAAALRNLCLNLQCPLECTIAIGDGANDIPMLRAAGLSVAYHAKPAVRQCAAQRLDWTGLDGVLQWFRA